MGGFAGLKAYGYLSWWSCTYICRAKPIWCKWFLQVVEWAQALAMESAGNNKAARIAMMAMTTRSSIKVNALNFDFMHFLTGQ